MLPDVSVVLGSPSARAWIGSVRAHRALAHESGKRWLKVALHTLADERICGVWGDTSPGSGLKSR